MKIPFNKIYHSRAEKQLVLDQLASNHLESEDSVKRCESLLSSLIPSEYLRLTSSCTHALEASIMSLNLGPDDEVLVPSFTYMSAANAVLREKAKLVFVDIDPETMNMSHSSFLQNLTSSTKAIIYMHYAGLSHDASSIFDVCRNRGISIIEDAAHALGSTHNGIHLGNLGDFGAISFHHTKNVQCGEGGGLICNTEANIERLEMILEKGTNRRAFNDGVVDRYDWHLVGSSFSMSQLSAAYLLGQLQDLQYITERRKSIWNAYHNKLSAIRDIDVPEKDGILEGNGHIFYIKTKDQSERSALISYLSNSGIAAYFHYPALHESPAGKKLGIVRHTCENAAVESKRLLRLPIYPDLSMEEVNFITQTVNEFYEGHR